MENLDKQKKRFLDGEITAAEYEAIAKIIEKEIKAKELSKIDNIKIDSPIKKEDTSYIGVVMLALVITTLVVIVMNITSKTKPTNDNIVKNEPNVTTEKTEREITELSKEYAELAEQVKALEDEMDLNNPPPSKSN